MVLMMVFRRYEVIYKDSLALCPACGDTATKKTTDFIQMDGHFDLRYRLRTPRFRECSDR